MWLKYCMLGLASAEMLPKIGACPVVKVKQDFNVEKYIGSWYQLAINKRANEQQRMGDCVVAEYSKTEDPRTIAVDNSLQIKMDPSSEYSDRFHITGEARIRENDHDGMLEVLLPGMADWQPYNVLDTDYENFAVVYSCIYDQGWYKYQSAWLITREQLG